MNKYERKLIGRNKFLKRVRKEINCFPRLYKKFGNMTSSDLKNFNVYRNTSTPCSCNMCSYKKYNRKIKHKNNEPL